jgi:hypothetical protein
LVGLMDSFRFHSKDFEVPPPKRITDKQAKYISSLYVSNMACRIIQERYLKVFRCENIWELYMHEAQEMLAAMIRKNNETN